MICCSLNVRKYRLLVLRKMDIGFYGNDKLGYNVIVFSFKLSSSASGLT